MQSHCIPSAKALQLREACNNATSGLLIFLSERLILFSKVQILDGLGKSNLVSGDQATAAWGMEVRLCQRQCTQLAS